MKNLKRALSLAVASVMLLGMMVVGSGAADIDVADYAEEIAVVNVLGIMEGDENGNFNGEKNITRNEMAVIMSNLMDLKLNGAHPFTDVPEWADKYVGAIYTNGLTAGTSATTYGGAAEITTTEAALMIMKTLGYFEYQGEFGDDWALATVKRATELKLFKDIEAGVKESVTRAEIAQMINTALACEVVIAKEEAGMSIEGNGISISQKPKYEYDSTWELLIEKLFDVDMWDDTNDVYFTIIEALTADDDYDVFGRPTKEIAYDDESVILTEAADYVVYADGAETLAEVLDDNDIDLDGVPATGDFAKGTVIEVYADSDDNYEDHIFYTFEAYEIEGVEKCDEDADEDAIEDGAKYVIDIDGEDLYDFQLDGFDAKTYVEGAWVVFPVMGTKVEESQEIGENDYDVYLETYIAETVSGKISSMSDTKFVRVNGTKYELTSDAATLAGVAGDEYTLVLDANGYVVAYDEIEGAAISLDDVYVYVAYYTDSKWGTQAYAVLANLAGEISEVEVADFAPANFTAGDLVVIDQNDDDEDILADWLPADYEEDYDVFTPGFTSLEKDQSRMTVGTAVYRLNADTQYVLVSGTGSNIEATVKVGGVEIESSNPDFAGNVQHMITKDGKNEALFVVIYTANEIDEDTVDTDNLIYIVAEDVEAAKDYDIVDIITAEGEKTSVNIEGSYTIGWATYGINSDGYYEVDPYTEAVVENGTTGAWKDDEGVIHNAIVVDGDLYGTLLTVGSVEDIEVDGAKFVDADDKDTNYDKKISSLSKLFDLLDKGVLASANISMIVEEDGATLIILNDAVEA